MCVLMLACVRVIVCVFEWAFKRVKALTLSCMQEFMRWVVDASCIYK